MDTTLECRLGIITTLPFLVILIESYQVASYFGAAFVIVIIIILVAFASE